MGCVYEWRQNPIEGYRMLLIEAKSHFNHVFAFPRACVIPGFEEELFIPYDNIFEGDDTKGKVLTARVVALHKDYVELDRDVPGFGRTHLVGFPSSHIVVVRPIDIRGHLRSNSGSNCR